MVRELTEQFIPSWEAVVRIVSCSQDQRVHPHRRRSPSTPPDAIPRWQRGAFRVLDGPQRQFCLESTELGQRALEVVADAAPFSPWGGAATHWSRASSLSSSRRGRTPRVESAPTRPEESDRRGVADTSKVRVDRPQVGEDVRRVSLYGGQAVRIHAVLGARAIAHPRCLARRSDAIQDRQAPMGVVDAQLVGWVVKVDEHLT